mmetsp:Transcript_12606/g.33956  ORF Transcript_12606/g.33956 Transcript_12606/m.33956 type:complete len:422 (-) Transcript_12606:405-1670(-)
MRCKCFVTLDAKSSCTTWSTCPRSSPREPRSVLMSARTVASSRNRSTFAMRASPGTSLCRVTTPLRPRTCVKARSARSAMSTVLTNTSILLASCAAHLVTSSCMRRHCSFSESTKCHAVCSFGFALCSSAVRTATFCGYRRSMKLTTLFTLALSPTQCGNVAPTNTTTRRRECASSSSRSSMFFRAAVPRGERFAFSESLFALCSSPLPTSSSASCSRCASSAPVRRAMYVMRGFSVSRISSSCGRKLPSSSMSASSITMSSVLRKSAAGAPASRPAGVATSTLRVSGALHGSSCAVCSQPSTRPPVSEPMSSRSARGSARAMRTTCAHSSRVGTSTSANGGVVAFLASATFFPSSLPGCFATPRLRSSIISTMGSKYASVLPEPVSAAAVMTSFGQCSSADPRSPSGVRTALSRSGISSR